MENEKRVFGCHGETCSGKFSAGAGKDKNEFLHPRANLALSKIAGAAAKRKLSFCLTRRNLLWQVEAWRRLGQKRVFEPQGESCSKQDLRESVPMFSQKNVLPYYGENLALGKILPIRA